MAEPHSDGADPSRPPPERPRLGLRDSALLEGRLPLLLVDLNGTVEFVNVAARHLFGIGEAEIGLPVQDLDLSGRPAELRSTVERCYADRQPVGLEDAPWERTPGFVQLFDVVVTPLFDAFDDSKGAPIGASITFADVTQYRKLEEELEHSTRELETMNEELQATIEELETTNVELQARVDQLDEANISLRSILAGLGRGVVVLDREMAISRWNHWSEDLWGLRSDEVEGRHFPNLDIGLPVEKILPALRECLERGTEKHIAVPARNRHGRDFVCSVTATVLGQPDDPIGVIVLMEEQTDGE